jgi:hypothetical protein
VIQTRGEQDTLWKRLKAICARRAPAQIDESGARFQSDPESSWVTFQIEEFGHGQKLDMKLSPALGQMGRDGTEITIVCGKGPVELGHQAANGWRPVDQHYILACLCQVERCLDPTKAATNHESPVAVSFMIMIFHLRSDIPFIPKVHIQNGFFIPASSEDLIRAGDQETVFRPLHSPELWGGGVPSPG